ncbi:hypothetical protein, partial [Pseudomonas syringae group genomosp. 7]|uniref:hypothetical protein n=1 Tax=Pseudomonas syringae group genomosp. 7 TaxID=251699 RepID=UPI0037705104
MLLVVFGVSRVGGFVWGGWCGEGVGVGCVCFVGFCWAVGVGVVGVCVVGFWGFCLVVWGCCWVGVLVGLVCVFVVVVGLVGFCLVVVVVGCGGVGVFGGRAGFCGVVGVCCWVGVGFVCGGWRGVGRVCAFGGWVVCVFGVVGVGGGVCCLWGFVGGVGFGVLGVVGRFWVWCGFCFDRVSEGGCLFVCT